MNVTAHRSTRAFEEAARHLATRGITAALSEPAACRCCPTYPSQVLEAEDAGRPAVFAPRGGVTGYHNGWSRTWPSEEWHEYVYWSAGEMDLDPFLDDVTEAFVAAGFDVERPPSVRTAIALTWRGLDD